VKSVLTIILAVVATAAFANDRFQKTYDAFANDNTAKSTEDELQHTYDLLRSKLSPSDKQTLKQLELRWIDHQKTLTGPASEQSERDQIAFLKHWLALVSPTSVVDVGVRRATPAPVSQQPVVVQATPTPTPQVTVGNNLEAPRGQFGTCIIHAKALIASSPEIRKRAMDLIFQKDEASFDELIESGDVVVLKADTCMYLDGPEHGLFKVHFRGEAELPYYANTSDVDITPPSN
jgi:hypothetical protein